MKQTNESLVAVRDKERVTLFNAEKTKEMHGITLIALVITIVVLLILTAVAMVSITGENGIIGKASDSKTESRAAKVQDRVEMWKEASYADNWLDNDTEKDRDTFIDELASEGLLIGDEVETAKTSPYTVTIGSKTISFNMESSNSGDSGDGKETISTSTSYIGYYADIEGDDTVDGIIYADLVLDGSGEYGTAGGRNILMVESYIRLKKLLCKSTKL